MKIRLPKGLRRALLASLAALALPATVSTTICTASGIAVIYGIVSQQTHAAYPTITSTDEYKAAAGDATKNAEGQTWEINVDDTAEGYQFWFQGSPDSADNWNSVTKANLHFVRTLTVGSNGSSDKTQTFDGALTGNAGANLVFNWAGHANTWQFNGSLAGFAGDISAKAGTINVVFGEGAQSNTGAIKQDGGTLNLTLNGQTTMNNSEIDVNNLTVNGTTSFRSNTTAEGTLTLNGGAALTMNGGILKARNVSLGGNAMLTLNKGTKLDWTDLAENNHTLTITFGYQLSDADIGIRGTADYGAELFGESWVGGRGGIILQASESKSGRAIQLDEQGRIIYKDQPETLTWEAHNDALEWSKEGAWDGGRSYDPSRPPDVHLTGLGGDVKISEDVTAVHTTIDGQGVFKFTGTDVTLTFSGILFVKKGSTMQVEEGLTVNIERFNFDDPEDSNEEADNGTLMLNGGILQFTGDSKVASFVLSEKGGTIGVDAGVTVDLVTMESDANSALTVRGTGTINFPGGKLKSLTQSSDADEVNVGLTGELTLDEESFVGGTLCFHETSQGTLKLGSNFEARKGIKDRATDQQTVGNRNGTSQLHKILSKSNETIELVVDTSQPAETGASVLGGGVQIGDAQHLINLVKTGRGHQQFGHGKVDIWGDVSIDKGGTTPQDDGALRIALSDAAEFHGNLSGSGTLMIIGSKLTLSGSSNQIGTLKFSNGENENRNNILALKSDLTVDSIGFCGFITPTYNPWSQGGGGRGYIENANGANADTVVYLLLNLNTDEDLTVERLYGYYYFEASDEKLATNGVSFGEKVGIGKGGDRDLKLNAKSGSHEVKYFKLAGTGTLTWTGGDQEIQNFTGEMPILTEESKGENADVGSLEGGVENSVGPTLRITDGHLTFGSVQGELKQVILDVGEGGLPTLTFGAGTLRAQTLIGATGAKLEIMLEDKDRYAGWLDFQEIVAENGPFIIRLNGENLHDSSTLPTSIQLFAQSEQWEKLREMLIGANGGGHAWTNFFRIELGSELVGKWGIKDLNDLSFRIDDRGRLLFTQVDYLVWVGTKDDVWDDIQKNGWENGTNTPKGKNVRFTEGMEGEGGTQVRISGPVSPANVDVQSGTFYFIKDPNGKAFGLYMSGNGIESGVLHIAKDAELHLNLQNSRIPLIDLEGTLGLGDAQALPQATSQDPGTKLQFNGGMILYDTNGVSTDLSRSVDGDSSSAIRIAVDGGVEGVVWGSRDAGIVGNTGMEIAFGRKGLEKEGTGDFTLAWKGDSTERKVNFVVNEGKLVLNVGGDATLGGAITGDGTLVVGNNSEVTFTGDNTVKYIELEQGTVTHIKGTTALGSERTTLTLAGGKLTGGTDAQAQAGKVVVTADTTVSGVTLAGAVGGAGALIVDGTAGLSGDLSGYKGTLQTGASGTWVLSEGALSKPANMSVDGTGTVRFNGAGTFGGEILGAVTLSGGGPGELTIVSKEDSAVGAKLAGSVALGNASTQAVWHDEEITTGSSVYLSNVVLGGSALSSKGGSKLYVRTATAKTRPARDIVVDVNGMEAGQLDGITINGHGQLAGVTGEYTSNDERKLELHFARENVDKEASLGGAVPTALSDTRPKRALIDVSGNGEGSDFTLTSADDTGRSIWVDSDGVSAILAILATAKDPDNPVDSYLHVMNGGTLNIGGLELSDIQGNEVEILRSLDVAFRVDNENKNLVFTGSAADVFVAPAGSFTLDDGAIIEAAKATVLSDESTELTLNLDGATYYGESEDANLTIHNLLGITGSQLHLQNSNAEERLTVAFDNTRVEDIREPGQYEAVDGTTVEGQHTHYNGSIDAGEGVDVTKTGYGTLSVGGTYKLSDGTTSIRQGALELRGAENSMEGLIFEYTEAARQSEQGEDARGLLLQGGVTTVRGEISDEGDVNKGDIVLTDAELVLNGQSTLEGTTITSADGSGTLTLKKAEGAAEGTPEPSLHLSGANVAAGEDGVKTVLSGVDVNVQDGTLALSDGATMVNGAVTVETAGTMDLGNSANNALSSLDVRGALKSAAGGVTTISGTAIIREGGILDSSTKTGGAGTLKVLSGGELTLENVTTTAKDTKKGWGIDLEQGGKLTIDVSKKGEGEQLTLGDVNFGSRNTVTFKLSTDTYNKNGATIVGNELAFGEGTTVVLEAVAGSDSWDMSRDLTLGMYSAVKGVKEDIDVQLKGAEFFLSDVLGTEVRNDTVIVHFKNSTGRKLLDALPNGAKNARAGASMAERSLWNKTKGKGKTLSEVMIPGSDYAGVMSYFIAKYDAGETPSMQRELAAFAGASTSILGPAFSEDLHRQLNAIRNRTTSMGNEVVGDNYGKLPLWHAWINAEGNYHKLDADALAPGYTLNSWGGTLGADADLSARTTVGFAISAMYGDLKADAADTAKGDLDTTYLSAFVRTSHGAWIHSFVASVGMANVKLNRTVNYGGSSYTAHGDTDGYAFGAMYEVGYTGFVNKSGTAALQPVVNVEVRHVGLDGYSETGSDAGLDVDDIDSTVVTFGAGARAQAAVGTNAFNRTTVLETRLLLKFDVGDRSGTASNAIVGDTARGEVESAEVGSVGVEFGVGISVPISAAAGSIFVDGSLEYRKGWTSANATVGYRVTF